MTGQPIIQTSRGSDQYILRFPKGMRDAIKDEARRNGRSMNSEIIHALSQAYAMKPGPQEDEQMSEEQQQLKLNMQPSLHAELKRLAKKNNRSLTSEIIHRLEASLLPATEYQTLAIQLEQLVQDEAKRRTAVPNDQPKIA